MYTLVLVYKLCSYKKIRASQLLAFMRHVFPEEFQNDFSFFEYKIKSVVNITGKYLHLRHKIQSLLKHEAAVFFFFFFTNKLLELFNFS